MKSKEYILEFNKVHKGVNEYVFNLDQDFLAQIEGAAITHASVKAHLQLIKANSMYELKFHLEGDVQCECDLCLEVFAMPINADYKLLIKLSEAENYDEEEIIYITEKLIDFDLSQYLYESLIVSLPTRKTCEMSGNKKCNKEVIEKLEKLNHYSEDADSEEGNPTWDKLKNIFNN